MLIDTHCHLDFKQFDADREDVIKRAQQSNIGYIINVAADLKGAKASLQLAKEYEFIFATAGIHPHYVTGVNKNDLQEIEGLIQEEKVVALGEVGLDYFDHQTGKASIDKKIRSKQQELLISFIEIANKNKKPIIFHCRDAHDDLLAIAKGNIKNNSKVVVHCFSGDKSFLKKCLDLGFKVSFTGNITYKKSDNLRELVEYVPLEDMFLETDAPFLAPEDKRGKRNEPSFVKFIACEVARIKKNEEEKIAQTTTNSARLFFNI